MSDDHAAARPLEFTLRDDPGELERLAQAVDVWAEAAGLPPSVVFHLNLSLDELLTNTISHGGGRRIDVAVGLADGVIKVRIVDDGDPFDPFTEAPPPDLDSEIDERPVGGLGVHLVRAFMDSAEYERIDDRNVVELTKSAGVS